MEFVIDTHALLWHLIKPERLGRTARDLLADVDAGLKVANVPAVVVSEAIMVAEKGRITGLTPALLLDQLHRMKQSRNYHLTTLTPEIVLARARLPAIPDIFDRLIVAEGISLSQSVMTRDPVIVASGLVDVIWD